MSSVDTGSAAPLPDGAVSEKTSYDVFLSYSHKDRDEFGIEYIERIKAEIEKALEPIITDHKPRVFLDAEALHLGDHWHSRIMESLNQCKAVVCLVSEAYLKSGYCTRERLWWNAKQTRAGRFLDGPYPVYFVKLEDGIFSERREVKEMMAVQTDPLPWFEVKEKLQETFIRERLAGISAAVCGKVRAAERARGSFCSVLPPLYENFVGRVTELRELHDICVNGKYPVIQAAGGVGKTELSVAYAYGFADRYPMGRFLFRMEHVASWDEAFARALDTYGTDAQGIPKKVFEELKIDRKDLEGKDRGEVHRIAARAFLERAARGKLLILLDNLDEDADLLREKMRYFLCDAPIPGNIHILATTRGSFRFSGKSLFTSYELLNLKEDEAFEMLCITGNGLYPFDRQPPSGENKEYQAAREVIRFLEGHAWSMEIVSAFMADNYDPEGFNFAMELDSLRKNASLAANFTYRAGEDSATSVELLRPTLDKLENLELGAETLELAVFAACFAPDEIPLYLLEEYWNLNFPGVACSDGVLPFIYAVSQLAKYHLLRKGDENCRMHRLVQTVFLSRKATYLDRIVRTLRACPFIPAKYWVSLLLQNPELIGLCPQDGTLDYDGWTKLLAASAIGERCPRRSFTAGIWLRLLCNYPEYASLDPPWDIFDGSDWQLLLEKRPQFADKCSWSKLDGLAWAKLLLKYPRFAEKCDWSKLDGRTWADVLEGRPQFAEKCDWSKLRGRDWADLLEKQPQFADRCDWSKLGGSDCAHLLAGQPQFADRCDWSKLDGGDWALLLAGQPRLAEKCDWSKLDGGDWADLLAKQPQFAGRCDWSKLDGSELSKLLDEQPQFADRCDLSKLSGWDWAELLEERPGLANRCNWSSLDGRAWADLLKKRPQFADRCDWNKLPDGATWACLLEKHPEWRSKINFPLQPCGLEQLLGRFPEFADRCDLDRLDGKAWAGLLREQPQFADRCDWSRLDGYDWADLLERRPQFADRCVWGKLDGEDWADLLEKQPQFADRCHWHRLGGDDWGRLLENHPGWYTKIDFSALTGGETGRLLGKFPQLVKYCDPARLDGEAWTYLLVEQPQFADRCDWSKLKGGDWSRLLAGQPRFAVHCDWAELGSFDWVRLLEAQPRFAEHCDWNKLDGEAWGQLLCDHPEWHSNIDFSRLDATGSVELLRKFPQLAGYCDLGRLDGKTWALLLATRPQFAGRCNWRELDGEDWGELLFAQPQFADKCDWEKLGGMDWAWLLKNQPQFARKCDWEKLDGTAWYLLLSERPQFANRCDWSKLDGEDWADLLGKRPEFAGKCDLSKLSEEDRQLLPEEFPQLRNRRCGCTCFAGSLLAGVLRALGELIFKKPRSGK